MAPVDALLKKLRRHTLLDSADIARVRQLPCHIRNLAPGEDFIRQGDKPTASAVVIEGMVARYHTLGSGRRQYLSVHIAGDWPDAQGLFLQRMDHSVCATGAATLCVVPHQAILKTLRDRMTIGFAIWRETLIDAAIFREAITNNGSRSGVARLSHFFAEIFARARLVDLVQDNACALPLSQTQLGEMLGMSIATVSRHLQMLRKSKAAEWRGGVLTIKSWEKLVALGDFDGNYLHQSVQPKR
jgi:CRP-like cAMP-binding protein